MNGHVTKKGSKYYVVIELERDANGKRRRKWFGGYSTKKAAQAALVQKLHELQTGQYIEESDVTVAEFLQQWLEYKSSQIRPSSLRSYESHIRHHIVPYIGHIKISKLGPMIIQKFYLDLQKGPRNDGRAGNLSSNSVRYAHVILHEALEQAVRWGLISRNVCDLVDPPRPQKTDIQVWDIEDINRFLEVARSSRYYIAFLLAIMTGLRKGEILGLRWRDVDFATKLITVGKTSVMCMGSFIFSNPRRLMAAGPWPFRNLSLRH